MKKALPFTLVLIGAALLITAIVFWIDSRTTSEPQSFGQLLRDWVTLLAGLGVSVKGWLDLVKKEKPSAPAQSNTHGGIIIGGNVEHIAKDVIGRDQNITTIVSPDNAYNVEGLANPYLGLQAFTYDERDRYAGREKLTEEALQLLVATDEKRNLLFVTGASGSGKSSFVQASLLPAIIEYYQRCSQNVKFEVIRPARNPKTRLDEALSRLGPGAVQVLVIDQFEELFTQSLPSEKDALLEFLRTLPPFRECQRHVIATLRSDYLGEMFDVQWLWATAKQGIELREMRIQELKDAILRPLQAKFPNGEKRFDLKLLERLAQDTAESVTYLPLLQVTLEELWNRGQLNMGAYNLLTDAIKERADTVLAYHDFDRASPCFKRTEKERAELLGTLLDLVNPSPDNDVRHDVRISRKLDEFNGNEILLLRELCKARLVSIEVEENLEIVNLIHETLIRSWDVLRDGIHEKRLQLQTRARFEEQLRLWIAHNNADDFLLSKGQLAEAWELKRSNDIALQTDDAQEFLRKSEIKIETDQKQAQRVADMERRVQLTDQELADRVEELSVMQRIDRELNTSLEIDRAMHITLDWAMRRSKAEAGLIGMVGDEMRIMAQRGYDGLIDTFEERIMPLDHPAIAETIQTGQAQFVALNESNKTRAILKSANSQFAIPILRETRVIGVLLLESTIASQSELDFLSRLSDHAAIAISNAQLYDALQRADAARSDFVSFVAHELKNPMTSIRGYAELLSGGAAGQVNEMQTNFLSTIRSNVERMSRLISDLNDATKIEARRLRLDFKAVDIFETIDDVIRSMKEQLENKKQIVTIDIPGKLPLSWVDRIRLEQILINLLSNANVYSPEGSEIIVGADSGANQWDPAGVGNAIHLWVKDQGIGINNDDQGKIFQKFFRSDDSKARESPGTGLGLNITKNLVEMMGGRIWFESEFRKGSTFHFTIPVADEGIVLDR